MLNMTSPLLETNVDIEIKNFNGKCYIKSWIS